MLRRSSGLRGPGVGLLLLLAGAGLVGLAGGCGPGDPGAAPAAEAAGAARGDRPGAAHSVLLITIDTLRADATGFGGNGRVATPTLDRLAAGGQVFSRAHAHNVVTLPSHANILTGLLPYQHGVRDNSGFVLPATLPTLATLFHDAGFATAAVVGAFPLDQRYGLARGFDLYDDRYPEGGETTDFRLPERRGDEVVARAREWWASHAGERRFLWIHLFDPHAPYEAPEPFGSRYREEPYLGEVAAVDAFLAPLLEPFLAGSEEPTVIALTADHGEALGEHGEETHGLFAYEGTLRVPLVLWGPGIAAGTSDRLAGHVDLLPTLLAATGVEPPGELATELTGRSLLASSTEPTDSYFEALTANLTRGWAPLTGVIAGDHKLISLPLPELYDLAADPAETENLYSAERRRARELAQRIPEEALSRPQAGGTTAEERAALASLGYLAGSARGKERYTAADDPKNLVAVDRKLFRLIDLYQRGRLEEATALGREIVAAQPDMGAGYYQLAQVLLERGRPAEALDVLLQAAGRGATDPPLLRQLGLLLAQAGRAGEAVSRLAPLAAGGDPDDLNAYGVVLSEAGRQGDARAALERVFARDPRNPAARQNLALVALRSGAFPEAESQARLALEGNPALPLAWNYLGVSLYNQGRVGEALDAWDRALELAPEDWDVLYNSGLVAAEAGDRARARRALERFVRAAPRERYAADLPKARALLQHLGAGG